MKIIKTIILYFIQITHTDDFLSTVTRLVKLIISRQVNMVTMTINPRVF